MQTTTAISGRNGCRLNESPADTSDIEAIFDQRMISRPWSYYEQCKADLLKQSLSPDAYQSACRNIADTLGI
ncbi:hypothetical protein F9C28_17595 [Shimwellia pseudoproteus]|uniref:hypothetical protein n=1 Tax=Shimwellia pseudoproteus TaxID=570012 RepID=UPI0018EB2335|nr:hypothetical protein [Shimwellia pseudoproteus]MBJ3816676.1 hypothetical protein [Shimwellia pseudoproteus]